MQARSASPHYSWKELLASPPSASHVVQIYDSDSFLATAVTHFAAEGLQRGEAVLLSGTAQHLAAVRSGLARQGVDPHAAERNGRLSLADAGRVLDASTTCGSLDLPRFNSATGAIFEKMCGDERFAGIRWWGEISNLLHERGDTKGALAAEAEADAFAKKSGVTVFCSYLCDRFDPPAYGILKELCCVHSHFIPAEDYVRHRLAVNRAIAEVVGEIRGSLLQSLASWKGMPCELPSSQALLFWLSETLPEQFAEVLARARAYHGRHDESLPL